MKIDIGKQVSYWLNGANEDIEVSKILIQKGGISTDCSFAIWF